MAVYLEPDCDCIWISSLSFAHSSKGMAILKENEIKSINKIHIAFIIYTSRTTMSD